MLKAPLPEAVTIIESSVWQAESLVLPPRQLARPLYAEIKRILNALGGEWNTPAQAFVFGYDYADRLHSVLEGREMLPERNPTAFFPTPEALATSVVKLSSGIRRLPVGARVLEPSAGRASLINAVKALRDDLVFEAAEIDPFHRRYLAERGIKLVGEDFLTMSESEPYDAIIMNPPFSAPGDKFAWVAHVEKAFRMLKPGGALVAILPDAAGWRGGKRLEAFRDRATSLGGVFECNPKDAFKESGTMTGTCTLFVGGINTTDSASEESHRDADEAAVFAEASDRIAAITPMASHPAEVAGIEEALQRKVLFPTATLFSDLFETWGPWQEKHNGAYIVGSQGPYGQSLVGKLRAEVEAKVGESMLSGFGCHFEVIEDQESGYTRVFSSYDRIIGGRLLAIVETRSLAINAQPAPSFAIAA